MHRIKGNYPADNRARCTGYRLIIPGIKIKRLFTAHFLLKDKSNNGSDIQKNNKSATK